MIRIPLPCAEGFDLMDYDSQIVHCFVCSLAEKRLSEFANGMSDETELSFYEPTDLMMTACPFSRLRTKDSDTPS